MEFENLRHLPWRVRNLLARYLEKICSLHSENVVSLFAYGAIVEENFDFRESEINLCVVLGKLSFSHLRDSLPIIREGLRKGIPAPLFLTREHIKSSQDVFPLEFLQMKDYHILLYGEDVLESVQVKREHLRLEVEEQIKGKLIHIRQAYLEMGLEKKGIINLLKQSLTVLIPVFRGILKLKDFNSIPPKDRFGIIKTLSENFNLDDKIFLAILNKQKELGKKSLYYLERYIEEIQKLAGIVDTL
ncbi:MAG: hypothetical protein N2606_02665 [Candidatus Omnitrophica bacterium]|nr:hypothetical protein [Candidatus Omnitrophota bacterium]